MSDTGRTIGHDLGLSDVDNAYLLIGYLATELARERGITLPELVATLPVLMGDQPNEPGKRDE